MLRNRMRAGIERGEAQIGTWLTMVRNPVDPDADEVGRSRLRACRHGAHRRSTIETIGDMAAMARALDFPIAVRPPTANREWITRLLDVGVWNLHCPQVESAAHAAEIVAASRYAPRGLRGNGGLSAATEFSTAGTVAERRAFANREVFVTVMIETAAAFKDLDAIAAMDGIDALTLGPADLAQDLGVFGTPEQARVHRREAQSDPRCGAAPRQDRRDARRQRRRGEEVEGRGRAAARLFERRRDAAWRLFGDDEATESLIGAQQRALARVPGKRGRKQ